MNRQHGSALILSLLILLVMTLLGITSLSTATMEEKMAANDRNQKTVMHQSELTLKTAENALANADWSAIETAINNNDAGYLSTTDPQPDYYNSANWQANTTCAPQTTNSCYIVEHIGDITGLDPNGYGEISQTNLGNKILRVTAQATDSSKLTSAMVQSHLDKTYLP